MLDKSHASYDNASLCIMATIIALAVIIVYSLIKTWMTGPHREGPRVWHKINKESFSIETDSDPQLIPKRIFQTNEKQFVPEGMFKAINSWIIFNPDYKHDYYTTAECKSFIKTYFPGDIFDAYEAVIPGAYKADIFRYCILYKYGGVYVDSSMVCLKSLDTFISPTDTFVSAIDDGVEGGIYNAFIAVTPKNPIISKVLDIVVKRVKAREYGPRDLYPTGPIALGDAFKEVIGADFKLGTNVYGDQTITLYKRITPIVDSMLMLIGMAEQIGYIYDEKGEKLILTKYKNHARERSVWSTTPHYSKLWKEGKIYM